MLFFTPRIVSKPRNIRTLTRTRMFCFSSGRGKKEHGRHGAHENRTRKTVVCLRRFAERGVIYLFHDVFTYDAAVVGPSSLRCSQDSLKTHYVHSRTGNRFCARRTGPLAVAPSPSVSPCLRIVYVFLSVRWVELTIPSRKTKHRKQERHNSGASFASFPQHKPKHKGRKNGFPLENLI